MENNSLTLNEALNLLHTWQDLRTVIKFACMNENNLGFSLVFPCTVFGVSRERVTLRLTDSDDVFQLSLHDAQFEHSEAEQSEDHPLYSSDLVVKRRTSGRFFLFMHMEGLHRAANPSPKGF
jgi:hypothetical protein